VELILILLGVLVLSILAITSNDLGVDSREFSDDRHRQQYPVGLA
jgi:hypothetical protein